MASSRHGDEFPCDWNAKPSFNMLSKNSNAIFLLDYRADFSFKFVF